MTKLTLVLGLLFSQFAFSANIDCADIVAQLRTLQKNRMDYDQDVVETVSAASQTVRTWYNQLTTYEGREIYIAPGAFRNVRSYSSSLAITAGEYRDEFKVLQDKLYELTESAAACIH
jgi:hypothetical protein